MQESILKIDIESMVLESGLKLTPADIEELAAAESSHLQNSGRIAFGRSASAKLIEALGSSPYLTGHRECETIADLIEAFYELREDFSAHVGDDQIIECLQEAFDSKAAGDSHVAASIAREQLASQCNSLPYSLTDDKGRTYRGDPGEWEDDVTANGWQGERWDADYE